MSLEVGPVSGARQPPFSRGIPPSPPASVRAEVERAGRRAEELAAQNRELHFETNSRTGRVEVSIRDLDGNVLERISGSRALELLS